MHAEMIYDITRQGFADWPWLAAAGCALLLAIAAWWRQRRLKRPAGLQAFFIAMAGVATLAIAGTWWDEQRLVSHLQTGQARVAEGEVQAYALQHTAVYNTQSKRYDRSTWESFRVGGTAFIYRLGGGAGAGFHNGTEPPMAITDGLRLRLHYVEDVEGDRSQRRIVRVERLCSTACTVGQG